MSEPDACRSNRYTMAAQLATSTAAAIRKRTRFPRRNIDRTRRTLKINRTGGKITAASASGCPSAYRTGRLARTPRIARSIPYTTDRAVRTAHHTPSELKSHGGTSTIHSVSSASRSRGVWVLASYAARRPPGPSVL